jgi:hypothetical protein
MDRIAVRDRQKAEPMIDQANHAGEVDSFVFGGIWLEVGAREAKKRDGGLEAVFLEMHKRAGELDERFEEVVIRAATFLKPEMFEDIVRFVELLAIEVHEVGVIRTARATATGFIE